VLHPDVTLVPGQALKNLEDRLDALTCAYVAYHCWRHGPDGFQVFGCGEHGCIVVPRAMPTSAPAPSSP
jgi:predicted RNase H-like nuclease